MGRICELSFRQSSGLGEGKRALLIALVDVHVNCCPFLLACLRLNEFKIAHLFVVFCPIERMGRPQESVFGFNWPLVWAQDSVLLCSFQWQFAGKDQQFWPEIRPICVRWLCGAKGRRQKGALPPRGGGAEINILNRTHKAKGTSTTCCSSIGPTRRHFAL